MSVHLTRSSSATPTSCEPFALSGIGIRARPLGMLEPCDDAQDKVSLSVGIAVGSSVQIALFVTPFSVLMGWAMGDTASGHNMDLNFGGPACCSLRGHALLVRRARRMSPIAQGCNYVCCHRRGRDLKIDPIALIGVLITPNRRFTAPQLDRLAHCDSTAHFGWGSSPGGVPSSSSLRVKRCDGAGARSCGCLAMAGARPQR